MRAATSFTLSESASEEPPNFITTRFFSPDPDDGDLAGLVSAEAWQGTQYNHKLDF